MAKKQSKLLTIYDNVLLREKVNQALDDKVEYEEIIELCKKCGIDVSKSTITRYAQKRDEATKTGQDLRELLDTETERTLSSIKKKRVDNKPVDVVDLDDEDDGMKLVRDDTISQTLVLEKLMKMGFNQIIDGTIQMKASDVIALNKLYIQMNGNNNHGITTEGLQQLRIFNNAVTQAMASVIMEYVPEDKQEEVLTKLNEEINKRYKEADSSGQGRALLKALDIGNSSNLGED